MLPQPCRRLKLGIGMNGTKRWRTVGALLVLAAAAVSPANAAELKIFGSRVTKVIVGELGMQFEKVTGYTPVVVADVAAVMKRRIEAGEPFDLAVLVDFQINDLIKSGKLAYPALPEVGKVQTPVTPLTIPDDVRRFWRRGLNYKELSLRGDKPAFAGFVVI